MRRIIPLFLLLIIIFSCRKDNRTFFFFSGETERAYDTLFVFGLDKRYSGFDTIVANGKGRFEYKIELDTITPLMLVIPNNAPLPFYGEPNLSATLHRDSINEGRWIITGGSTQTKLDSMLNMLDTISSNLRRQSEIDKFIEANPFNEAGIYLIRKYFVDIKSPIYSHAKRRVEMLGGTLRDNDYLIALVDKLRERRGNVLNSSFPAYSFFDIVGQEHSVTDYKEKFILLTVWASWDSLSRENLRNQHLLQEKFDTSELRFINISMDYDTALWRRAVEEDSLIGLQTCDMELWDNKLLERFNTSALPQNIFVNPRQRVLGFNLSPEDLKLALDTLVSQYKKEQKKIEKEKRLRRGE